MKPVVLLLSFFVLFTACSKKAKPTTAVHSTNNKATTTNNNSTEVTVRNDVETMANPAPAGNLPAPMIVIDGLGRTITPASKLPDEIAAKVDYRKIALSFTPNQKANLMYRYKMVPPKVLYVPDVYIQKSLKGEYCVYKKQFWYWKKADGLFYLDETYYK